jgi:AraC-like DNA-binding protein
MRIDFSTEDVPLRDRVPLWCDLFTKQMYAYDPGGFPDPRSFRAEVHGHVVGEFALFDEWANHTTDRRTAAHVARTTKEAFYFGRMGHATMWRGAPRSTPDDMLIPAGDFIFTSSEFEFNSVSATSPGLGRLVVIPHKALSPLLAGGRMGRPFVLSADSPLGFLMGSMLDGAKEQLPRLAPEVGEAVLHNLAGLVAIACGASDEGQFRGRQFLRAARLESAKRFVDSHLDEMDLTPAKVAIALGISVRSLHLAFEPTGISFAEYVMKRRLQKCRAALVRPVAARSITDVAFAWGFANLTTFYRAFRREFGVAPGDLRPVPAGAWPTPRCAAGEPILR